jgi:transposase
MMKTTRRNYTREFKLEAVRLLETSGKSAAQIQRDLGIGSGCLGRWKRECAAEGEHARNGREMDKP